MCRYMHTENLMKIICYAMMATAHRFSWLRHLSALDSCRITFMIYSQNIVQ